MSVFKIFVEHWLVEENKARRTHRIKKRGIKIKTSVCVRLFVRRFFELMEQHVFGQDMSPKMRNYGVFLGKSFAVGGVCRHCEKSVVRFEIFKEEDQKILMISCQNEECRAIKMVLNLTE